jgi:hypothetical protein
LKIENEAPVLIVPSCRSIKGKEPLIERRKVFCSPPFLRIQKDKTLVLSEEQCNVFNNPWVAYVVTQSLYSVVRFLVSVINREILRAPLYECLVHLIQIHNLCLPELGVFSLDDVPLIAQSLLEIKGNQKRIILVAEQCNREKGPQASRKKSELRFNPLKRALFSQTEIAIVFFCSSDIAVLLFFRFDHFNEFIKDRFKPFSIDSVTPVITDCQNNAYEGKNKEKGCCDDISCPGIAVYILQCRLKLLREPYPS